MAEILGLQERMSLSSAHSSEPAHSLLTPEHIEGPDNKKYI